MLKEEDVLRYVRDLAGRRSAEKILYFDPKDPTFMFEFTGLIKEVILRINAARTLREIAADIATQEDHPDLMEMVLKAAEQLMKEGIVEKK